jgi:hypothetical protein
VLSIRQTLFTLITKQATFIRRSTVLFLPFQLAFPGSKAKSFFSAKKLKNPKKFPLSRKWLFQVPNKLVHLEQKNRFGKIKTKELFS